MHEFMSRATYEPVCGSRVKATIVTVKANQYQLINTLRILYNIFTGNTLCVNSDILVIITF